MITSRTQQTDPKGSVCCDKDLQPTSDFPRTYRAFGPETRSVVLPGTALTRSSPSMTSVHSTPVPTISFTGSPREHLFSSPTCKCGSKFSRRLAMFKNILALLLRSKPRFDQLRD